MVEAAAAVDRGGEAFGFQELLRLLRDGGSAGCVVAQLVERLGKAGEIVDRRGPIRSRDHRQVGFPVRRGDEDCLWLSEALAERRPRQARRARLEGVHRRAVRDEDAR